MFNMPPPIGRHANPEASHGFHGDRRLLSGQPDAEDAAPPELAFDLHGAPVEVNEMLHDREPETRTRTGLRAGPIDLVEALEDPILLRPGNPRTLVGDRDDR